MTSEEEAVLKEFLRHYGEVEDDEDFEAWYLRRYEGGESEEHYKQTLHLAQVWKRRYEESFQAGLSAAPNTNFSRERTLCLQNAPSKN